MNSITRTTLVFLLMLVAGAILIFYRYDQLSEGHLELSTSSQRTAIDSTLNTYKLLSDTIFSEIINTDETLTLVNSIVESSGDQRNLQRGLLYRKLAPIYERLRPTNVRQLHFHCPNGNSMLRLHTPAHSGDPLFDIRSSVEIANTELREVHGYESGRVFHGFRHVYPLIFEGHHIGSVEVSTSFFHIQDQLKQLEKTNKTTLEFILYKPDFWNKLFAELQIFYSPSGLHTDYVSESADQISFQCRDRVEDLSLVSKIKEKLLQDPNVQHKMEQKQSCNCSLMYNYATYSVVFHSIKNIEGNHAAYIVAITPEPFLAEIRSNALQLFSIYIFLLSALYILRLRFVSLLTKQQQHAGFLQNISDNMGIGLYSTNKKGIITFANTAAIALLGYDKKDLIGQHAHNLFHIPLANNTDNCFCDQILSAGAKVHTDHVVFWSSNANAFPVEVVCTPLYDKKNIVGTATVFQDISKRLHQEQKLMDAQEKLRKIALQDGLTGIPNRRSFDQRSQKIWRSAMRRSQPLGLLMIDIDHFKLYNDHYGHQKGDDCLTRIAKLLEQACKRPDDFVARYGGEEFVVLLPNTNTQDCSQIGKRMLAMLAHLNIPHQASPTKPYVTVSIGCCSVVPNGTTSMADLIACADQCLYHAKNNGRNSVSAPDLTRNIKTDA